MSKHPPLTGVKSSAISGYHYDPETGVLHLGFNSGSVHHYSGVSPEKADKLRSAESIGSFFHKHIRGQHPEKKVSG